GGGRDRPAVRLSRRGAVAHRRRRHAPRTRRRPLREGLWQVLRDCRQAARSIGRTPFVSSVVIASVALGVGVNTTVFSWIQAIVLDPIPGVRNASAMRLIEPRTEGGGHPGTSWVEYRDLE